jgi:hypothetical protein
MLVKTARTFLTTLEEEYWDFRAVFLLPSRHTPLVKPPGLEPRFATPVPGRARLDPAQESLQVDALDTHGGYPPPRPIWTACQSRCRSHQWHPVPIVRVGIHRCWARIEPPTRAQGRV